MTYFLHLHISLATSFCAICGVEGHKFKKSINCKFFTTLKSNNEIGPQNLNTDPIESSTQIPKQSNTIAPFPILEISETSYSIENHNNVKTTTNSDFQAIIFDPAQQNIVEPTRLTSKTPIDIRGKGF